MDNAIDVDSKGDHNTSSYTFRTKCNVVLRAISYCVLTVMLLSIGSTGCSAHTNEMTATHVRLNTGTEIETFENWSSLWAVECGTIIHNADGSIFTAFPGNCITPLQMWMASPLQTTMGGFTAGAGAATVR